MAQRLDFVLTHAQQFGPLDWSAIGMASRSGAIFGRGAFNENRPSLAARMI
jgi:hypothetical protein